MIYDGKIASAKIQEVLKEKIKKINKTPTVAIFSISTHKSIESFIKIKRKFAENIGIKIKEYNFKDDIAEEDFIKEIQNIINTKTLDGVIIQLPLPQKFETQKILNLIPKDLDIDCLSKEIKDSPIKESHMIPPVAGAIKYILEDVNTEIKNKKIVIIGYGKLVGEPVYKWFLKNNINPKIIDIKTEENIKKELYKEADIVISGVGIPNLLKGNYFKKDVIIIDAGTSEQSGVITGDCDPSCKDIASIITPVPGGVGPLTVACLFKNLIEKYN